MGDVRGESDPNQEALAPEMDREMRTNRDGRIVNK